MREPLMRHTGHSRLLSPVCGSVTPAWWTIHADAGLRSRPFHDESALVAVDRSDPVLAAEREGRLASFLREALEEIIGEPLTHVGHTLYMIEIGFGHEVPAPSRRDPD